MRHNDDISNDKTRWKAVKLIQCFKREFKIISGPKWIIWNLSFKIERRKERKGP